MSPSKAASAGLDETSANILRAIGDMNGAVGCAEIATKIGVPTSQVSCRMAPLRKRGLIDSPAKSKYVLVKLG